MKQDKTPIRKPNTKTAPQSATAKELCSQQQAGIEIMIFQV
jgi:hypothetical protein